MKAPSQELIATAAQTLAGRLHTAEESIYNGEPLHRTVGEQITIDKALGTDLNYDEIMGSA